jgi:hypothetical protein
MFSLLLKRMKWRKKIDSTFVVRPPHSVRPLPPAVCFSSAPLPPVPHYSSVTLQSLMFFRFDSFGPKTDGPSLLSPLRRTSRRLRIDGNAGSMTRLQVVAARPSAPTLRITRRLSHLIFRRKPNASHMCARINFTHI